MNATDYQGFEILSRPYKVARSGLWTVEVEIRRDGRARSFGVGGRYQTEKDADIQCRDLGRRIIDGNVPGWSVDRLRPVHTRWSLFPRVLGKAIGLLILAAIVILGLGGFGLFR